MIDRDRDQDPQLTGTGIKNQHLTGTGTGTGIKNVTGPGQLKVANPGTGNPGRLLPPPHCKRFI